MTEDLAMAAGELELFRKAPALRSQVAHIPLGRFPTPVDRIELSGGRVVLVKRDDQCGAGYAGNKLRKLEFLLADAQQRGARRLITAGAAGSHHAFATAYHGRRLGFDITLVLFPQVRTQHVRDMLLLDHAVGAELRWVSRMEAVPFGLWRARREHHADNPVVIPPGGSNALGTLGYVNAGLELAAQVARGEAECPTTIHVATGTMGTVAGIAIGLVWGGLPVPIVATRITTRMLTNERVAAALTRSTVSLLQTLRTDVPRAESALRLIRMQHDQIGEGYGRSTAAAEAAEQVFGAAGLRLDCTYTAKAAATLLLHSHDERPLFWHTLSAEEPREMLSDALLDTLPEPFAAYLGRE